jgi:hypothetical protein
MPKPNALAHAPTFDRAETAHGVGRIHTDGGDNGAGLIEGFAVLSRAEALGHGYWIDEEMLAATAEALNANPAGIKSRFTHPGLSGDGLGSFLGRAKNARVDGDIVRADLHLSESARNTPDGDLAGYVLQLAADDPEAFGTSIVFRHDVEAERGHLDANSHVEKWTDGNGNQRERNVFASPDPLNTDNLAHARLQELKAVDVVDEPAANPGGMFQRGQEIAEDADSLLSYALGLTDQKPVLAELSIDPDRVSGHFARFLTRHGLSLVSEKEALEMADDNTTTPATPPATPPSRADFTAELDRFTSRFGAVNGVDWLKAGKTFDEALDLHVNAVEIDLLASEQTVEELTAKVADLETKLAAAVAAGDNSAETPVVEFSNSDGEKPPAGDGDDTDNLAEKHWKKHKGLRDEFAGDFGAFNAMFNHNPEDFSDLN